VEKFLVFIKKFVFLGHSAGFSFLCLLLLVSVVGLLWISMCQIVPKMEYTFAVLKALKLRVHHSSAGELN
jgi:hypothetical protein